MNTNETIGTCELCGATDHHLVMGECPGCRKKCAAMIDALFPTGYSCEPTRSCNHDGANSVLIHAVAVLDPAGRPAILADEDLEYWGRYFVENRLDKRGVRFETFMTDPFEIAQALLFGLPMPLPKGEEFYPLLPRQREVALRVHPRVRAITRPARDAELPVFLRLQAD